MNNIFKKKSFSVPTIDVGFYMSLNKISFPLKHVSFHTSCLTLWFSHTGIQNFHTIEREFNLFK